jgi:hypothetical protein
MDGLSDERLCQLSESNDNYYRGKSDRQSPSQRIQANFHILKMSLTISVGDEDASVSSGHGMTHNESFESSASTLPATSLPNTPKYRRPSRRRSATPPQSTQGVYGGITKTAKPFANIGKPCLLESIMGAMSRFENNRSPTASSLRVVFQEEREAETRRRAQHAASIATASGTACRNCGETDPTKSHVNAEKDIVCSSCGACNGRVESADLGFETVARADLPTLSRGKTPAQTVVASADLKSAHRRISTHAQRSAESLDTQNLRKRDKVIRKIHSMFVDAGRNPTCQICVTATDIANRYFQRAVAHSQLCSSTLCPAALHKATFASIACESVCHAIDALRGDLAYENHHQVVEESVVLNVKRLLGSVLDSYQKHQNVAQSLKLSFQAVLTMSPTKLSQPCPQNQNNSEVGTSVEQEYATTQTTGLNTQLQKLQVSLQSISAFGWADARTVDCAQKFCNSPEGFEWIRAVVGWNPDLVALILVSAALPNGNSKVSILQRLSRRAQKDRVAWESVSTQMGMLPNFHPSESSSSVP